MEQAGAYAVVVSNETGVVTTPPVTLSVSPATTFAHWQRARFTDAQLNDSTISGPSADPGHSGIPNLLRYAFNTAPFSGDCGNLSLPGVEMVAGDNKQHLTFTYRQRIGGGGLSYVVEVSDDLVGWDPSGAQIEQVGTPVPSGDGVTQLVKTRLKLPFDGLNKKFMRLKVVKN